MCEEEQEENSRVEMVWNYPAPRPNHYGECVGEIVTGLDSLARV